MGRVEPVVVGGQGGSDELRQDRLSRDRQVLQRARGHRSGTDDVLAAFSAQRAMPGAGSVLDLGCGHGTVTLLLSQLLPEARFVCVEAQEVSASLCQRNLALNGLARARVIHRDLRGLGEDDVEHQRFDLITGTPPFMPPGSGVLPADAQRAAARFELRGGIEQYCEAAARFLAPGGRVSMLMDGAQDARVLAAFAGAGLEVLRVTRVVPRVGKAPRYTAVVGGLDAAPRGDDELLVRDEHGEFSAEYRAIRGLMRLD